MQHRLFGKALPFFGALLALLIALPQSLSFYIDWLWFQDLGFEKIFTTRLNAQLISALAGGLAAFLFAYVNLWIVVTATRGRSVILPLHVITSYSIHYTKLYDDHCSHNAWELIARTDPGGF